MSDMSEIGEAQRPDQKGRDLESSDCYRSMDHGTLSRVLTVGPNLLHRPSFKSQARQIQFLCGDRLQDATSRAILVAVDERLVAELRPLGVGSAALGVSKVTRSAGTPCEAR